MREERSRDAVLFPASQPVVTLPALHQIRMFCAHWANLCYTGKPAARLSAHPFLWEKQNGLSLPFLGPLAFQVQGGSSLLILPFSGRVYRRLPTAIRQRWSISEVSLPCVCVCVRKHNLLLAHSTPMTHTIRAS